MKAVFLLLATLGFLAGCASPRSQRFRGETVLVDFWRDAPPGSAHGLARAGDMMNILVAGMLGTGLYRVNVEVHPDVLPETPREGVLHVVIPKAEFSPSGRPELARALTRSYIERSQAAEFPPAWKLAVEDWVVHKLLLSLPLEPVEVEALADESALDDPRLRVRIVDQLGFEGLCRLARQDALDVASLRRALGDSVAER